MWNVCFYDILLGNVRGAVPTEPMPSIITGRLPTLDSLEAYALEQWEVANSGLVFFVVCFLAFVFTGRAFPLPLYFKRD